MIEGDRKITEAADVLTDAEFLEFPPEQMRKIGYSVIDAIVERAINMRNLPIHTSVDRASMDGRLMEAAPESPTDPLAVLDRAIRDVLADGARNSHPRYYAYVPNPSNYIGAMADALAAGFNTFAGMWAGSPGAAEVELVVTNWIRDWCGFPATGGGLLLSGSSMANLVGMAAARHARFGQDADAARLGVIYFSDQAHSSIANGARLLGIGLDRQRKIATDSQYRMRLDDLRAMIDADRAQGLISYCVIAAAGTTNTAAVDPIPALRDICKAEDMWLHADGAFAAAAILTEKGKAVLAGLESVDSLAVDAHKWLFQPIECGCLLVRDVSTLRDAFHERPEYLRDADTVDDEINFCDLGPQLTREFRALKLWMSIQTFGLAAFRAAVERGIALAELAERSLRASGTWEIVTPAQLGVVTFRFRRPSSDRTDLNSLNVRIAQAVLDDGYAAISTTELRGRTVLRMCITNPRASDQEIVESVRRFGRVAESLTA